MDASTDGPAAQKPLEGVYAFSSPSASITLHQGLLGGIPKADRHAGVVELNFARGPYLIWRIEGDRDDLYGPVEPFTLSFQRNGQAWRSEAIRSEIDWGILNHAEYSTSQPLGRVIAHWVNLPEIHGNEVLTATSPGGSRSWWTGRFSFSAAGWDITIDRRQDFSDIIAAAKREHVYAITHVMELRRSDGKPFSADAAVVVLENIRVATSFALGRWAAPMLPVGFSEAGTVHWESWSSPIVEPLQKTGYPVLYQYSYKDVSKFLTTALEALEIDGTNGPLRFQMISAVLSNQGGFTEQRISTAFTAIENLAWVVLVLRGHVSQQDFESRAWTGTRKLGKLLSLAKISPTLHGLGLPALESFAGRGRSTRNGPAALVKVRNCLVHPKSPRDEVYHIPGLMTDAWLLSRCYLNMLVLYAVGYDGEMQVQLPMDGWLGETRLVPWATVRPLPDQGAS
ncbi:hypothetical protein [Actinoplanes sp. NPDC051411]|uniref:hypothetical protein n=1 Tax=Actinoplanes sp. NPDC051411 TaxID=3155522 RepID=UPI003437199C